MLIAKLARLCTTESLSSIRFIVDFEEILDSRLVKYRADDIDVLIYFT